MNRTQYYEMKTGNSQGRTCAVYVVAGGIGGEGDSPLTLCTVTLHTYATSMCFMTGINNFGNTSLPVCLREQISPVINNYIVLQPCLSADMLYDGGGVVLIASWGAVARLLHVAGGRPG